MNTHHKNAPMVGLCPLSLFFFHSCIQFRMGRVLFWYHTHQDTPRTMVLPPPPSHFARVFFSTTTNDGDHDGEDGWQGMGLKWHIVCRLGPIPLIVRGWFRIFVDSFFFRRSVVSISRMNIKLSRIYIKHMKKTYLGPKRQMRCVVWALCPLLFIPVPSAVIFVVS